MNKERVGGFAFAVFGLLVALLAGQIRMPVNSNEPGPRLFPCIAGFGMMLCGIGMMLTAPKEENKKQFLTKTGWIKLLKMTVVLFLYYLGLQILGFIVSTFFFTIAIILLLADGKKVSKILAIIVAAVTTAVIYLVFQKAFLIQLPTGIVF
jgi:putative tricarboxylic transport membrane protein